jgi:hypothetical protein
MFKMKNTCELSPRHQQHAPVGEENLLLEVFNQNTNNGVEKSPAL